MLKDPSMQWEEGAFPYDSLKDAEITPYSSMKQIHDGSFDLIEKGLWDRSRRSSWDALRKVESRLWVDFLMYPLAAEQIAGNLATLLGQPPEVLASYLMELLTPDFAELERLSGEFGPLPCGEILLDRNPDFDETVTAILQKVNFDE
jgi:hypothetical protein